MFENESSKALKISISKVDKPIVFIPNRSGHDYRESAKYGHPVYVTEGIVDRFAVQQQARLWMKVLIASKPDDFILISSMSILTAVGSAIFGWLHGRINLLLFRNNKYIERIVIFDELKISAFKAYKEAL